jgi:hypothetical protein
VKCFEKLEVIIAKNRSGCNHHTRGGRKQFQKVDHALPLDRIISTSKREGAPSSPPYTVNPCCHPSNAGQSTPRQSSKAHLAVYPVTRCPEIFPLHGPPKVILHNTSEFLRRVTYHDVPKSDIVMQRWRSPADASH